MIVVDTSALVAILLGEPAAPALRRRLASEGEKLMSTASYLEAGTVIAGRRNRRPLEVIAELDLILAEADIRLSPVDEAQGRLALEARIRYGRGFGSPARLNFGDCFAYALAKSHGAPLLYVGDDFAQTDLKSAL